MPVQCVLVLRRVLKWPCRSPSGRTWWRQRLMESSVSAARLCALRWSLRGTWLFHIKDALWWKQRGEYLLYCDLALVCAFCMMRWCVLHPGASDVLRLWQPWLQHILCIQSTWGVTVTGTATCTTFQTLPGSFALREAWTNTPLSTVQHPEVRDCYLKPSTLKGSYPVQHLIIFQLRLGY